MITTPTSAAPLDGVRVIDMTSMGMGPLAGQILGDFGADVIKIEPPGGDVFRHNVPQSSHGMAHTFIQFNRNKRSLAIDLKTADGQIAMRRLLETADVVLSNLRPQALKGLGLGEEVMRTIKPDLIFCAAYGYSERGPYAGRPAADDAIQAMSGVAALQHLATGSHHFVANVIADKVCGLAMVNAVLAAVIHRMKTGQGQSIEVPMFETMVAFTMAEQMAGRSFEPSRGPAVYFRVVNPDRRPYPTKDGHISVMPYTTAQWMRFFRLIGRDDLAVDPAMQSPTERSSRFPELYALIAEAMPSRTTQEWVTAFLANDLIFGVVNSPEDLFEDPHLAAMDMFPMVEHPTEGKLRMIGFPISFSETPNQLFRLPPRIGQHSREILEELGFDEEALDRMQKSSAMLASALVV